MLTLQLVEILHQGLRERLSDPRQHMDLFLEHVDDGAKSYDCDILDANPSTGRHSPSRLEREYLILCG